MKKLTPNANRFEPYRNFKFQIKWNGRYVAGFSKMNGLFHKLPGKSLSLENGVTHDPEFEIWANKFRNPDTLEKSGLNDIRRDIIIEIYDESGQMEMAYKVYNCRTSEFQALPDLDANANAIVIKSIHFEYEGFEKCN